VQYGSVSARHRDSRQPRFVGTGVEHPARCGRVEAIEKSVSVECANVCTTKSRLTTQWLQPQSRQPQSRQPQSRHRLAHFPSSTCRRHTGIHRFGSGRPSGDRAGNSGAGDGRSQESMPARFSTRSLHARNVPTNRAGGLRLQEFIGRLHEMARPRGDWEVPGNVTESAHRQCAVRKNFTAASKGDEVGWRELG
jgi:hypothetical protein